MVWQKRPSFVLKQGIHLSVHSLAPLGIFRSLRETFGFNRSGAKSAMRQVGLGYRVASQTFGVLMLSCVLVTIWWILVGGGLGEPEDEDDEDSSAGVGGGGGEGVCDGGGSGG